VEGSRGEEAAAVSGSKVVNRLVVGRATELGFCAKATRVSMQLLVNFADFSVVKTGGGESILGLIESFGVKDFARLLGEGLAQMVIVDLKTGDVALVAGEDSGLASDRGLIERG
jgi:hypothetical protein